jgi:AcrR family transcriptional regulator
MVNTGSVVVAPPKTRRPYRSPEREARAHATRKRVLRAAVTLFAERGYAATTIRSVAAKAKVSVPTVETLFGTKARLLKATIDVAIAGDDEPVPMLDRDWATAAIETPLTPRPLCPSSPACSPPRRDARRDWSSPCSKGPRPTPSWQVLAAQMSAQRATMATWVVDRLDCPWRAA